jgi:predicted membrane protein
MSETKEDKNPERRTNRNDQDFPSFIMAVIALVGIWMLAGFTVFQYTTAIVLVIKLVEMNNSNSTTNNKETNTPSSSQVCMNCSNEMRNNIISDLPTATTIYDPTTINARGQFKPAKETDRKF